MNWGFLFGSRVSNRFINQRIIQGVELRFVYIGWQPTNHRSLFLIDKDAAIKGGRFLGFGSIYPSASIFCHLDSICLAVSTVNYIIIFDDKILYQTQRVTVVKECCWNIRLGICMDATDSGDGDSYGDLLRVPRHCLVDCVARVLAVAECDDLWVLDIGVVEDYVVMPNCGRSASLSSAYPWARNYAQAANALVRVLSGRRGCIGLLSM